MDRLEETIQEFIELETQFRENFDSQTESYYYIVSKKQLDRWKAKDFKPDEDYFNEDIKIEAKQILKYDPLDTHMWNTGLKEGLQFNIDYVILNYQLWSILKKDLNCHEIKRDSIVKEGKLIVNVYPQKLSIASFFYQSLKKLVGHYSMTSLITGLQFVSPSYKLRDYIELIELTLQTVTGVNFVRHNSVRFYRCPPEMTFETLEAEVKKQLKNLSPGSDPIVELKDAEYLTPQKYETIQDCEILPNQVIVMDCKENNRPWCIKNDSAPSEARCENCCRYNILTVSCACKKVSYCNIECQKKDESYHLPRCEKTDSDDEEAMSKIAIKTDKSVNGLCGLRNLGNTCFLNSGIQCLSNTKLLTDFFLSGNFLKEINTENPLGTKGELAKRYANIIRRLWNGESNQIAPITLKRTIEQFQSLFEGYQQHDCQELITYLLDGLHEDLNRIKTKPYIEIGDSEGREDQDLALEYWNAFIKRNDSIITENMYGLYKSKLECPKCSRISIAFDPYLMVSVTIPQNNLRKLLMFIVDNNILWKARTFEYEYDKGFNQTVQEMLLHISNEIGEPKIHNIKIDIASNYGKEDDIYLNQTLSEVKKNLRWYKLVVRQLNETEQAIPQENRISIIIAETWQEKGYSYKRKISPCLSFFVSENSKGIDLHKFIFETHLGVLCTFEGLENIKEDYEKSKENWKEFYQKNINNVVWQLVYKSNWNGLQHCSFCGNKHCDDCQVKITDEDVPIKEYFKIDNKLALEINIVWQRGLQLSDPTAEKLFDNWVKVNETKLGMEIDNSRRKNNQVATSTTLSECLLMSSKPEKLAEDNAWYCKKCQDHVQAFKTMEIYLVPKILVFHLKRFKQDSNKYFKKKLEALVKFPLEGLDMTEHCLNNILPEEFQKQEGQSAKSAIYDLYAVSNHYGGLGGGHYTAFAKNILTNDWFKFDDENVTKVDNLEKEIVQSSAYILFYKRRN